jgi:spore maturation protein A
MSWIWTGIVAVSLIFSALLGKGPELAAAVPAGAQAGITLAISMAGAVCLWTGVGKLMEKAGVTDYLSTLLRPIVKRIFPSTKTDSHLSHYLSANICANFLGLGNAATPMGILAVKQMKEPNNPAIASDEMCRLIVLNTASIFEYDIGFA